MVNPLLKKKNTCTVLTNDGELYNLMLDVQNFDSKIPDLCEKFLKLYIEYLLDISMIDVAQNATISLLLERNSTEIVERYLDFIARTAKMANQSKTDSIDEEMSEYVRELLKYFLEYTTCSKQIVRIHSCQSIAMILRHMGSEAIIDENLFLELQDSLVKRMDDVKSTVREQAVFALSRLQVQEDTACPVNSAFMVALSGDSCPSVRKAILKVISVSRMTVKKIIERTRDINSGVRKLALVVISDKIHMKALRISERLKILKNSMNDKSSNVKNYCENVLLAAWLYLSKDDLCIFVKALNVEISYEFLADIFKFMVKSFNVDDLVSKITGFNATEKIIPPNELSSPNVFVWCQVCRYVNGHDVYKSFIDKFIPSTVEYIAYLRKAIDYLMSIKNDSLNEDETLEGPDVYFIIRFLVEIAFELDTSDVYSRNELKSFLYDMLVNIPINNVSIEPVMKLYVTLFGNPRRVSDSIIEIISEIRQPIQTLDNEDKSFVSLVSLANSKRQSMNNDTINIKNETSLMSLDTENLVSDLIVKKNILRDRLDIAISEDNYIEAQNLMKEINDIMENHKNIEENYKKRNDVEMKFETEEMDEKTSLEDSKVLTKCLIILKNLLRNVQFNKLPESVCGCVDSLILNCVQSVIPVLRLESMVTLSLCAMYERVKAIEHLPLFIKISSIDPEYVIRSKAICIIFDLLSIYGTQFVTDSIPNVDSFPVDLTMEMTIVAKGKFDIANKTILYEETKDFKQKLKFNSSFLNESCGRPITLDLEINNIMSEIHKNWLNGKVVRTNCKDSNTTLKNDEVVFSCGSTKELLIYSLLSPLDNKCIENYSFTLAVDGICRLFIRKVIFSQTLLAKFLTVMFTPKNIVFKFVQILSSFFVRYAEVASNGLIGSDGLNLIFKHICQAWIISLKNISELIFNDSDYIGVEKNMNEFMLQLISIDILSSQEREKLNILYKNEIDDQDVETEPEHVKYSQYINSKSQYHKFMFNQLIAEMMEHEKVEYQKICLKTLLLLDVDFETLEYHEMINKIKFLKEGICDAAIVRYITKLEHKLSLLKPSSDSENENADNTLQNSILFTKVVDNDVNMTNETINETESNVPTQSKNMRLGIPGNTKLIDMTMTHQDTSYSITE
ncbi:Chromosome-associated protein G [Intoshia linei]|uniref:Chromosome-associated protein G n=1 Tax=Intoshia linei TaxID=1819745 RepID=A0A177B538_9BILA|nr:Chromosome-associated protein G [Intoshia linei]